MKYFKFTQISAETGISWLIAQPLSGPSMPTELLPGLTNIIQLAHSPMYYIGQADDSAQPNPENYIFEIATSERAVELKRHVEFIKQMHLDRIYQEEKEFRQSIFDKYDQSASIAGVYKYEEAKQILADSNAPAPQIRQEAIIRGVTPVAMATRVVSNHEDFRSKEAKIAGIRGLIYDRLVSYNFDLQNPDISLAEFLSEEKIGERTNREFDPATNSFVNKVTDVKIGKYTLNIGSRYQYL